MWKLKWCCTAFLAVFVIGILPFSIGRWVWGVKETHRYQGTASAEVLEVDDFPESATDEDLNAPSVMSFLLSSQAKGMEFEISISDFGSMSKDELVQVGALMGFITGLQYVSNSEGLGRVEKQLVDELVPIRFRTNPKETK